ncbi:MAG: F0F1 ATP synthase subunit A [Verrucomicrobiota bacterium]
MRLIKVIFFCGLPAMLAAASLKAQMPATPVPAVQPATAGVAPTTAAPAPAEAEPAAEAVPQAAPALFYIGPAPEANIPSIFAAWWPKQISLPITNSMVCTWIVAALILVVVRLTTWRMREVPAGGQNVMEALIEGWEGLIGDILDKRVARWVFPFATTFFIFIIMSNYVDLIPGVGSIGFGTPARHSLLPFAIERVSRPFFRPPTTDANLTVAMAGIFLVMSIYWGVRYNGVWGLVKHIFGVKMETNKWAYPLFLLLFIFVGAMELLSVTFARPVALAMRLYGNIFAGESILDMAFHSKLTIEAIGLSIFVYFYETFVCAVQAFVFAMLVVAFVGTLCTHSETDHGR